MTTDAAVQSPYMGLRPFEDSDVDALLFFGRERETEVIAANLLAARLTVLYGPSGVGKSSVLRAGVMHRLRSDGDIVVRFESWSGDPVAGIADAVRTAVTVQFGEEVDDPRGSLADRLGVWSERLGAEIYLVLDQLEEYFLYHGRNGRPDALLAELPGVVNEPALRVNVLLGIREDALALLDAFKARIPQVLGNYLRLDRLDRAAGEAAVLGPLAAWNELTDEEVAAEPALVEALLDEVAVENGRIEAPYLQVVLDRVWEAERADGSTLLRRATLAGLGGAQRIVDEHLERALARLDGAERDTAAAMFAHLVTPGGTKIAHELSDLATYAGRDVHDVAAALVRERILRPVEGGSNGGRVEIYHDVLAGAVADWRVRHESEQRLERERQRQRKLVATVVVLVLGLALMTGLTVYAFSKRAEAQEERRSSHARELAARALVELDADPQKSLASALQAAELEPTQQAEVVLRRALVEARLRAVVPLGSPARLVSYSPDGAALLVATADRGVVVWDVERRRVMRRLAGGGGEIVAIAWHPDEGRFLTAEGSSAVVWSRSTGSRIATVAHSADVTDASFGAGGVTIVTASSDGIVRVSWPDGALVYELSRLGKVRRAELAPDGRSLAVVSVQRDGRVESRLYRDRRLVRVLDDRGASDVAFTSDASLLATANRDGSTHVWDARTGRLVHTLDDEGGAVYDLAFSSDGTLLATANSDGGVRVWRVETGGRHFFFVGHTSPVLRVAFDAGGNFLASVSSDRTARVWQTGGVEAGTRVGLLVGHETAVGAAAFSPDGRTVATASADGTARVWDARFEHPLEPLANLDAPALDAEFSQDGRFVAIAGLDGSVRTVNADDGRALGRREAPQNVIDVAISPDGTLVASTAAYGPISLWTPHGALVKEFYAPGFQQRLRFSPDGRLLAAASTRGVRLWRVSSGETAATLEQPRDAGPTDLALGRDLVAVAARDGSVRIWDLERRRVVRELPGPAGPVTRVVLSPDGSVVAAGGHDGTIRLWTTGGRLLRVLPGHPMPVTDLRFNPSGTRLVTTSEGSSRNATVWDVATGRRLHDLVGHFGTVRAGSFSFDGRWIVTAGPISAVVWNTENGRLLFYLRGHTDLLTSASFSPRGYIVLTSARDGTVRTYTCEVCVGLDGLVVLARQRLRDAR